MDSVVVGSEEIRRIITALKSRSPVFSKLKENLFMIAVGLGIDYDSSKTNSKLLLDIVTVEEVLEDILKSWILKEKQEATVHKFVRVLESNKLNDFAKAINQEFREKPGENKEKEPAPQVPPMDMAISLHEPVRLDFENINIKSDVMDKITPDLVAILNHKDGNKKVILQFKPLGVFENTEIDPLLHREFPSEQDRIIELLGRFQCLDPDELKRCLETLCNLNEADKTKRKIRDCFNRHFPQSVKRL